MISLKILYRNIMFAAFLICCSSAHSQRITVNQVFYLNYLSTDTALDDSILQEDVRILFAGHNDTISRILEMPADTGFYASLMNSLILVFPMGRKSYEVNLHNIEKKGDTYFLKCMVLYSPKDFGTTDLIGFIRFPFRLHGREIKFGNYFREISEPKFSHMASSNIYTNKENIKNLDSISDYIHQVSTRFGISMDKGRRLFYIYYPENGDPYEVAGLENYFGADQGRAPSFGDYTIIFDKHSGGFYKHELVHFTNKDSHLSPIFEEGFASYLGGSSWKCNNVCDYEKLLQFLEKKNADSVVLKIIENKYADNIVYQFYFYPLGSITTHLMIKKYGDKLFDNKTTAAVLRERSPVQLYAFLSHKLNTSGLSLSQYYINALKTYLHEYKSER